MKNESLARWLQDHMEMLGRTDNQADSAFHTALYEGVIEAARTGEAHLIDTLLGDVSTTAARRGRPLPDLLSVPRQLRQRIWDRIGEEIDPEPAFVMLATVEAIFTHIIDSLIELYWRSYPPAPLDQAGLTELAEIGSPSPAETEQKMMEYAAELAQANRELARLEQAKTDFISIAAHELKTPLTLIQGYVNILRDIQTDPQVLTYIEGINRGSQRMNTIIEDMLDLSALDTDHLKLALEQVNLKSAVELTVVQLNEALAERKQSIETAGLESLPLVEVDVSRLHQILSQVLSNAVKYTPDGGKITISGQALEATAAMPAAVRLIIKDTGVGIAPEDRDKIFERFYRTGNSNLHSTGQTKFMGAGPGLGLAIVKGLVEAHGGWVWAESQGFDLQNCPGSAFNIVLPIQAAPRPGVRVNRIIKK
ncbi:MAG: HAMP domain-containing sensor histidine kinase [Chloroflexota bacterium]